MSWEGNVTETEVDVTSTKTVANINLLGEWKLDISCAKQRTFIQLLQGDLKIGPEASFKTMQSNVEARAELKAAVAEAKTNAVTIAQTMASADTGAVSNVETVLTCVT